MNFKPWIWAFIVIQVLLFHASGANPDSRLGTLVAMKDRGAFDFDRPEWSLDVSIGPDGKVYSNKAPGPALLAFPVFYVLDELVLWGIPKEDSEARYQKRIKSKDAYYIPLCLIFQILPFAFVVLCLCRILLIRFNLPKEGVWLFFVTCLFANSASSFMNSFFGHGMAAMFLLAMGAALLNRNWVLTGLFFGLGLLCDYGVACLAPGLLWIWFKDAKPLFQKLTHFVLGGVLPGVLWIFYHQVAFGGPFEIAIKFQDPSLQIVKNEVHNFWGVFSLFPKVDILAELLWGWSRGLLWTQPWCLLILGTLIFSKSKPKEVTRITPLLVFGFALLLVLNANFGGWWGGGSTGPRYLSIVFPLMALPIPFLWKDFSKVLKSVLIFSVIVSVLFWALVFATSIHAPLTPLWPWFWDYFTGATFGRSVARLAVVVLSLLVAFFYSRRSRMPSLVSTKSVY